VSQRKELQRQIDCEDDIPIALSWAQSFIKKGLQSGPVLLVLTRPRRTADQNDKLWPMLRDVSLQCDIVVDGVMEKAEPEVWKDVFTAALTKHQQVVQGIDGSLVFVGRHTSKMTTQEFSDLIELIYAYGAEKSVVWSEKSAANFEELRR